MRAHVARRGSGASLETVASAYRNGGTGRTSPSSASKRYIQELMDEHTLERIGEGHSLVEGEAGKQQDIVFGDDSNATESWGSNLRSESSMDPVSPVSADAQPIPIDVALSQYSKTPGTAQQG
jgi:hypothetical protein